MYTTGMLQLKTLSLCYTNQSVNAVQGNNRCLFSIHTKHINTVCGQNIEFLGVKPGGTYSDRWAAEG